MTIKFYGSIARLERNVRDCNVFGEGRWLPLDRCWQFRSTAGEILDWRPDTGTVTFHGQLGPLQRRFTAVFAARNSATGGRSVIRVPCRMMHSVAC